MSISRSSLLLGALLLGAASTGCGGDRVAPDAGALDAALDGPSDGAAPSDAAPSDATPSDAASPSCEDGTRNGFETDVDCGGSCPAGCPAGAGCARNGDCEGGLCEGRICAPASCEDGARNGDETDVDCGGSCPLGCGLGQGCAVMADCAAGTCLMEVCQPPGCMDGLVNGAETDLDCGGPECSPCGDGEACRVDGDCRSGRCAGDSCVLESCLNGVLEAAEVGIDCGGPCPACPAGTPCAADLECASGACVAGVCEGGAVSCLALRLADPLLGSGIYELQPDPAAPPRAVYCDMTTDGGGWTLVASTRGGTLNDERADWYADLGRATPSDAHLGIWDGLRPVIRDVSDIRFTCDVTVGVHEVDLSFYETGWYREITTGTDAESCFSESNGAGADVPPPERRNNRSAELLPLGDPWNAGYLEGEDSCSDEGDFTVDFDDRGMDSNQSDGTDWGEDDGSSKCGSSGSGQIWQIWVREALCSNGTLDGDETDLDCGGSCRPCADGRGCG
ncbi:MAG: fibrinogen-like YCDxxxxGGGW domain-containing protein, partial [Myxococcales bacterium]|nr:fibrinogen-like YCDxxxxGGGW domain-containing protein [Myxococcales bacterium]